MQRRNFIKLMAAAPLVRLATAPESLAADVPAGAKADPNGAGEPDWVLAVRQQMPACQDGIYLQTGSFGASPLRVVERVRSLMDLQLKGPANPRYAAELQAAEDSCRPVLAKLLGGKPGEIALAHNTTEGMNIVIWSLNWSAGDEIITSNHEHPALMGPFYNLQDRFGVKYRQAAIDQGEDVVANVLAQVSPRTRLVALSHVSRRSGRVIPVRALADALHARGIKLLLDGAQAAGNVPFNFAESGCDYYSFCGHKWLLGPKGTGGVLIRQDLLAGTPISYTGAHAHKTIDSFGVHDYHPDSRRFEYGTRAQFNFGGFAEAVTWLDGIGQDRIFARVKSLSSRTSRAIEQSGKFKLVSPSGDDGSGIVVVRLPEKFLAKDVSNQLLEKDRILTSPLENPRDLRLSVHFFNTWPEIEHALARLNVYCS